MLEGRHDNGVKRMRIDTIGVKIVIKRFLFMPPA